MDSTMTLTGYVGHNIELKQTRTGIPTVSFRVGTTPRIKTSTGWIDAPTTWTNVVCYKSLAEHVAKSVDKGDAVVVHGRVRTQAWTDSQGAQHERMVLEAAVVGHDLNRGVCAFAKSPRTTYGPAASEAGQGAGGPEPEDSAEVTEEPDDEFAELDLPAEDYVLVS